MTGYGWILGLNNVEWKFLHKWNWSHAIFWLHPWRFSCFLLASMKKWWTSKNSCKSMHIVNFNGNQCHAWATSNLSLMIHWWHKVGATLFLRFFDEIVRILPKNYRKISKSLEPNIQARWFSLMKSCISRKVSTLGLLKLYNIGTQWRDCFECSQNIRWQFKPNTL